MHIYILLSNAVNMAKKLIQQIDVRHHFLRDSVEKGLIKMMHCGSYEQLQTSSLKHLEENNLRRIGWSLV